MAGEGGGGAISEVTETSDPDSATIEVSESSAFEDAGKLILNDPGNVVSLLAFGNETLVEEVEDFHSFTTPKGSFKGRDNSFTLKKWQSDRGDTRYTVHLVGKTGELFDRPSAAMQINVKAGVPTLKTIASDTKGIGLGSKLLDRLNDEFGEWKVTGPISQSGARLIVNARNKQRAEDA